MLACPLSVSAGEVAPDAKQSQANLELTLEQCLRGALEANLSLSAQALTISIAGQGVISAESAFDSQLGLDLLYEKTRSAREDTRSDRRRADLSWSKKIRSGQVFSVTHNASRSNSDLDVPISPFYDLDWTFSAVQPLARGAGRTVNMAPVWIARNEERQSVLVTEEAIMDLLEGVESAYLNLLYAVRFLDVQQSGLSLAKELLSKNEELARIGKLPERSIEVQQAKTTIASREEGVIIALSDIAKAEDAVRRLMNLPVRYERDSTPLVPADTPLTDLTIPPVEESLAFALAHRPQLQSLKLDLDSAALELSAARNNRLPNVDLRADVGFSGANGNYSSAFDELAEGRDYVWQVGLSVSYPLGNRAAQSRYNQARLNYERAKILLNDFIEELRLETVNAHRNVQTDVQRMSSTKAAAEQAELQLELENELYAQGMSDSFRILQFQDDLIAAKIRHLAATTDFNRSYYNLLRVEGRAIRNEQFDLTDITDKILRQVRPQRRKLVSDRDLIE
jgi:outer membrane protein